jgi:hypothetical protein
MMSGMPSMPSMSSAPGAPGAPPPSGVPFGPWIVPGEDVGRRASELQVRKDGPLLAEPMIPLDHRRAGQYSTELYRSQPETAPELIHTGQLVNPYTGERACTFEAAPPPPDRWGDEELGHTQHRLRAAQGTLLKPRIIQKREVLGVVDPLGGGTTEESQLARQVWADSYRRVHGELYTTRDGIYEPPEMTRNPSGFMGHVNLARPTPFLPPTKSKGQELPWSSNQAAAYGSANGACGACGGAPPVCAVPVLKPERFVAPVGERSAGLDLAAPRRPRASEDAARQQCLGRPFSRPTMELEQIVPASASRVTKTRHQPDYQCTAPELLEASTNHEHSTSRAPARQALAPSANFVSPAMSKSGGAGEEVARVKQHRTLPIHGAAIKGEEKHASVDSVQAAATRQSALKAHVSMIAGDEKTAQPSGELQTTTGERGHPAHYGASVQVEHKPSAPSAFADAASLLASLRVGGANQARAVQAPEASAQGEHVEHVVTRLEAPVSTSAFLGAELFARPTDAGHAGHCSAVRSSGTMAISRTADGAPQTAAHTEGQRRMREAQPRHLAQAPRNADALGALDTARHTSAQESVVTTRRLGAYQAARNFGAALLAALLPRAAVRVDTSRGATRLDRSTAEGFDVAAPVKPASSRSGPHGPNGPQGENVATTPALAYDVGQQARGAARTRSQGHREAPCRRQVSAPAHVSASPKCAIASVDTRRGLARLPDPVPCKVQDSAASAASIASLASLASQTSHAKLSADRSTPGLQVRRSQ